MKTRAVILAAGEGKRMNSATPKVLHRLCGWPLIQWAMAAAAAADTQPILVVGHGREEIMRELDGSGVSFAVQQEQKGTGHAVMTARELLADAECILVTCGDMPLIRPETIQKLVDCIAVDNQDAAVLYAVADDPAGYGRIVRNEYGEVKGIVEHRDATPRQREIREVNTSTYCFHRDLLLFALDRLDCDNDQKEYYLTDVISIISNMGGKIVGVEASPEEGMGVNDRAQLAQAARVLRGRINREFMLGGVTIVDPDSTYIDADVKIGRDTIVYPGNVLESGSEVGECCVLYPNNRIVKSCIGNRVEITASVITDSAVGDGCHIVPFTCLQPGSTIT